MRMERPEAEILHRRKREKKREKSKDDRRDRDRDREQEQEQRENGALTKSKQTAQRKRYYPPLH